MHSQYLSALALALPVVAGYTSTLGCYSKVPALTSQTVYIYQNYGYCTDKCSEGGYRVAALSSGKKCACSNELPDDSAKVDADKCNVTCEGWPEDNCGGNGFYTVLSTGDYSSSNSDSASDSDSESNSASTDTIIMAAATSTTSSPSTAGGGIVVAPTNINESNVPTNILTAPASMVSKASASASAIATANAKVTSAPGIVAANPSSTPSSTPNAAATLRAGPIAGAFVAGLGLLL
ncbi:hypothetical protein N7481_012414 [Penicillium waksmanii]|uniref:uncharacterized protein n=1 Tax=Penicillium waksmanii TaxID=69791 RepID=UPI0025494ED1|nr:uncharacterized protein N7481_012414 [Penicillium waksmanii]KAJ5965700.1 hypothetical protein N7481_012414 [Penicillium waksmanii]